MVPPKKDPKSASPPTSGAVRTEQRLDQALDPGSGGQPPPAEEGLPTEPPCRRSRAEEDGHQSTQVDSIPF